MKAALSDEDRALPARSFLIRSGCSRGPWTGLGVVEALCLQLSMDEAAGLLLQEEGGGGDHEPLLLPLPQVNSPITISLWFKFHPVVYRSQSVRFS